MGYNGAMGRLGTILPSDRPFFIAEAGVNHDGRLDRALALVDAAADAGADAVKFQTFRADALVTAGAAKAGYQAETTGGGGQRAMLRGLELSEDAHRALASRCRERGLAFLSTPFDEESADLLERLDVPLFKLASPEVTNHPFLEYVGRKGRPVILSTGMSTLEEVAAAVEALRRAGASELALLHCVSSYPAEPAEANLRAMATLAQAFGVPVGWSDHTLGTAVAVAAAALGARIVEKHFTLDRGLPGPDHRISLEPAELKALAAGLREAAASLGDGVKAPRDCEADVRRASRRSIVLAADAPAGMTVTRELLAFKRPAGGLPPSRLREVLGRRLARAMRAEEPLGLDCLE